MSEPMKPNISTFDEYQEATAGTAIYPYRGTLAGFNYCMLKSAGETGEAAERLGKFFRDKNGYEHFFTKSAAEAFDQDTFDLMVKEIGDKLWYLAAQCHELGITLGYVAALNVEKLLDRKNRGVLGGSGDTR